VKLKTILVPVDFSDYSLEAVRWASMLAAETKARILLVHVWQPPPAYPDGVSWATIVADQERESEHQLQQLEPTRLDVECERRLLTGDPATEIVNLANNESCDMIVVGTHGRSGIARWVLGSVTEAIMRHATCPVLVVKLPQGEAS
jgi:nucleotide-binding universal stress UspA family protein